jgi:hypothetical protein
VSRNASQPGFASAWGCRDQPPPPPAGRQGVRPSPPQRDWRIPVPSVAGYVPQGRHPSAAPGRPRPIGQGSDHPCPCCAARARRGTGPGCGIAGPSQSFEPLRRPARDVARSAGRLAPRDPRRGPRQADRTAESIRRPWPYHAGRRPAFVGPEWAFARGALASSRKVGSSAKKTLRLWQPLLPAPSSAVVACRGVPKVKPAAEPRKVVLRSLHRDVPVERCRGVIVLRPQPTTR